MRPGPFASCSAPSSCGSNPTSRGPAAQLSRRHVPRTTDLAAHSHPHRRVVRTLKSKSGSAFAPARRWTAHADQPKAPVQQALRTSHSPSSPGGPPATARPSQVLAVAHPRLNAVGACHASAWPRHVTYPRARQWRCRPTRGSRPPPRHKRASGACRPPANSPGQSSSRRGSRSLSKRGGEHRQHDQTRRGCYRPNAGATRGCWI
jgi:hypothetical protein